MSRPSLQALSFKRRIAVLSLVAVLVAVGLGLGWRAYDRVTTTAVVAYFDNTNGLYVGDKVKVLGVDVGEIDAIDPDGDRMKVSFHYDSGYQGGFNRSSQHLAVAVSVAARRRPRPGFASRGSCGAGC
ncbi:MlaD family protein [Rhodococcus sp. T2V]|uniref:MlaD family protein n=1 Tax=Rhodococcus sp. T2V TaxID=3034164 RepID=UPI0023E0915C|nr:MlaD family protein [Rhodococcus sp. T2V]MDF3312675.1 MlaD family protein [Rhodococcus sp. T2V]